MNPDCLPCAGASRPTIEQPVGKKKKHRQQHADYGQTVTDHYFSGGHWTAGFRAVPETVWSVAPSTSSALFTFINIDTLNPNP